jgi:hypothetical protein
MKSNRYIHFLIVLCSCIGLAPLTCAAQERLNSSYRNSPYRADISLQRVYEAANHPSNNRDIQNLPTVTLQGRIRGVGFVDARFSIRRNKNWVSTMRKNGQEVRDSVEPVLLQGRLAVGGSFRRSGKRILPAAASIIGDELKLVFVGRARGSRATRQRIYTITMKLDGSLVVRARVGSVPRAVGRRGACGAATGIGSLADHAHGASEHLSDEVIAPFAEGQEAAPTELARVVTISTDADPEWYRKYGEQSNAVIASIINTAEAVFHRQLGLRFRVVKQHVYADQSPYQTTNSSKLLSNFALNPENSLNLGTGTAPFAQEVDLKHLFTGKDLDGSVIGIAYIGALCAFPSMSYGVTQSYMDVANPAIFAHELGHNFGAMHDPSTREGLMYPAISVPPAQGFSEQSLTEINRHLNKYGTCISLEPLAPRTEQPPVLDPNTPFIPTPAPAPITLTLRETRAKNLGQGTIKLSGSLTTPTQTPIGAVGVRLFVEGQEIGRAVTKANGRFVFYVRLLLPEGKKVSVVVRTEGSNVASNELQLSRSSSTRSAKAYSTRLYEKGAMPPTATSLV